MDPSSPAHPSELASTIIRLAKAEGRHDARGVLLELPADSDILVISCSGVVPEKIIYAMENTSKKMETQKLFICDERSAWYYTGLNGLTRTFDETVDLVGEIVAGLRPRLACAIGTSGGGYMALALTAKLRLDRALALGPQTMLGAQWRAANHDIRWETLIAQIHEAVGTDGAHEIPALIAQCYDPQAPRNPQFHVVYPDGDADDCRHAALLDGAKNTHLYCLKNSTHNVSAELWHRNTLFDVLNTFIDPATDDLVAELSEVLSKPASAV